MNIERTFNVCVRCFILHFPRIQSQIETETECVKSLEEECHFVDKQCSDLDAIAISIEGDIATKEQVCKTMESITEVFVEKQIELTSCSPNRYKSENSAWDRGQVCSK